MIRHLILVALLGCALAITLNRHKPCTEENTFTIGVKKGYQPKNEEISMFLDKFRIPNEEVCVIFTTDVPHDFKDGPYQFIGKQSGTPSHQGPVNIIV